MTLVKYARIIFFAFLVTNVAVWPEVAGAADAKEVRIVDDYHYSTVFAGNRTYRVFVPRGYAKDTTKRYPVIYFFHGWAQRYFGSVGDGYANYDSGDQNDGDNIRNFVSRNDVIVVKVDGLNQFSTEPLDLSPYNVSTVTTFRQFPTYFKELVNHIDARYRTIPDRQHRAVSGLSMGGFMTFWLAAKYPDMISAAGNFCGSTEFMAGPVEFPTEYAHAEMFDNVKAVSVRMHNGTRDRLRFYHEDFNRYWLNVVPQYEFKVYEATHTTCGLGDMFSFLMDAFESPLPLPKQWDYIDIFPRFEVWDYQVETNRTRAGFTILENVNEDGFKVAVRNFLPDGELMPHVPVTVKTAPVYTPKQEYWVSDVGSHGTTKKTSRVRSDFEGRLSIVTNGGLHHIGIGQQRPRPDLCLDKLTIDNLPWAETGQELDLSLHILNKGAADATAISAEIIPLSEGLEVIDGTGTLKELPSLEVSQLAETFNVRNNKTGVEIAKFKLVLKDKDGLEWQEEFELRFKDPVPEITDFEIADGRHMTVVEAAVDSVTGVVGAGNGDGIANPGETIVILAKEGDKFLRTNASTLHPQINAANTHIRVSDRWQNYDHIGGSAKYTQPVISSEIAAGEEVWFYLEYWLPGKISGQHIIKKAKAKIKVTGTDKTPPQIQWLHVLTNDRVEARVYDGGGVQNVTIAFAPNKDASTIKHVNWKAVPESFEVKLLDTGTDGDAVKGDGIFSRRIRNRSSYFYDLKINVVDDLGNSENTDWPETVFLRDTEL